MKKILLTIACVALTAIAANAQVNEKYTGNLFNAMSPNGRYLADNDNLSLTILNRNTGETYYFDAADFDMGYTLGLGKSINDEGTVVGAAGYDAMICKDGVITVLPQLSGEGSSFNIANAITPDGKYIIGALGFDGASFGADGMMCYPVLWTLQEDGSYVCEALPFPTTDFTGRVPQYVSGLDISSDGNVAIAHIADWAGYYPYTLLYTKAADGSWSYKELAPSIVYDAELIAQLPEWAGEEPTYPDIDDYMTEDDLANYEAAMEYYYEQVAAYNEGLIEEYPTYPTKSDYISSEESKTAYEEALAAYSTASDEWYNKYIAFDEALMAACTGASWVQNQQKVSANGLYIAADITKTETDPDDFWSSTTTVIPARFTVADETMTPEYADATDELTVSIMNDGAILTGSPSYDYTRNAYYRAKGEATATPFADYITARNAEAGQFIKDNCLFDVTNYSYDEDWNEIITVVEDSLLTGTICCNPEGTIFLSYLTDMYTDETTYSYLSYIIDLNEDAVAAIGSARADKNANVIRREFFNLQGQRINTPLKGVYLEKVVTEEGTFTEKRVK